MPAKIMHDSHETSYLRHHIAAIVSPVSLCGVHSTVEGAKMAVTLLLASPPIQSVTHL